MHNLLEKVLFYVCCPSIIINRFLNPTPSLRSVLIWKINGRVGGLFSACLRKAERLPRRAAGP